MKKKVVPKLRQEVKVKVDIVTSDDIRIYYTGKFWDFTARYIIKYYKPLETEFRREVKVYSYATDVSYERRMNIATSQIQSNKIHG